MECPNCNEDDTCEAFVTLKPDPQKVYKDGVWCFSCRQFFYDMDG